MERQSYKEFITFYALHKIKYEEKEISEEVLHSQSFQLFHLVQCLVNLQTSSNIERDCEATNI